MQTGNCDIVDVSNEISRRNMTCACLVCTAVCCEDVHPKIEVRRYALNSFCRPAWELVWRYVHDNFIQFGSILCRNLRQILVHPKDKVEDKPRPIVCTKFHVRPAIWVTLVKKEEHLAQD